MRIVLTSIATLAVSACASVTDCIQGIDNMDGRAQACVMNEEDYAERYNLSPPPPPTPPQPTPRALCHGALSEVVSLGRGGERLTQHYESTMQYADQAYDEGRGYDFQSAMEGAGQSASMLIDLGFGMRAALHEVDRVCTEESTQEWARENEEEARWLASNKALIDKLAR